MEILLVRHGETRGNVARRHQVEHTPLNERGREQASKVADEIKDFKPTHLITSSRVRTIETARIISETCNLIPETCPHFIELVRPSYMYGCRHHGFKSIWFYVWWYLGSKKGVKDDGESYKDFRDRLQEAQHFLTQYPEDARIVVVSHTVFISFFLAHLCSKKPVNPLRALMVFHNIVSMPNTHVTPLVFDKKLVEGSCHWSLVDM